MGGVTESGFWIVAAVVVVAVLMILVVRKKQLIRGEGFRKLLHFICLILLGVWTYVFPTWKESVIGMALFVIVIFPVFKLLEKTKWFEKFLAARKKGELANSLVLTGIMFILVTLTCQGLFGSKLLTITSIYAWGPGDAAAALIGKKFGKHKIGQDKLKSAEGTAAMFVTAFACVAILLGIYGELSLGILLVTALVTALGAAASEFYSKNGNDTIICPLTSMILLSATLYLSGNLAFAF